MKKLFLLIALVGTLTNIAKAQQIHQLSQYMLNDFAYNPAVAGSNDKFISKFIFRKQWTGVEGAPTTGVLSVHGNLSPEKKIGLGAILYSDVTGPTRRSGAQLAYAYHLPISLDRTTYLGMGLSANIMQYGIKFDELILQQDDDPQIGSAAATKIGADANLGLYLKNPNYWVGISANQLFASKFKFDGNTENIQNARHIYLTGGYRYLVNDNFALTPALLAKFVKSNRPQAEINLRGAYIDANNNNEYWLGLAYRTEDALSILAGLDLGMGFNFAYSYDITTSKLNTVSNGSHEISLGYNFAIVK